MSACSKTFHFRKIFKEIMQVCINVAEFLRFVVISIKYYCIKLSVRNVGKH